jgi:hypothetical protein
VYVARFFSRQFNADEPADAVYTIGIIFRFIYRNHDQSLGIFLIQNLFIILSPCAFIASVYTILGQLAARNDADGLVPIRPTRIAKTFVWSGQCFRALSSPKDVAHAPADVITFLIQAGGGGLEVQASSANIGAKVIYNGRSDTSQHALFVVRSSSVGLRCSFSRSASSPPSSYASSSSHARGCLRRG